MERKPLERDFGIDREAYRKSSIAPRRLGAIEDARDDARDNDLKSDAEFRRNSVLNGTNHFS